jgi:NAD(P)-dependent dehydrogenase (short-subunit alcohol dehydrogenase family)
VNVFGVVSMIKAVPFILQRRSERITNVTSMGGMVTLPGLS